MAIRRGALVKDASGQYFRQLGYKHGIAGQPKFRLGKDQKLAELAYHRLTMLWDAVVSDHERRGSTVVEQFVPTGGGGRNTGPLWPSDALLVAEAIRKHKHIVRLPPPVNIDGDDAYALYIDHARGLYGQIIAVLPENEESAKAGKESHAHYARHRSRQAGVNSRIAQIPIPAGVVGQTLYAALDAYAEATLARNKKESGRVHAATALRLKSSTPDMDLSEFGYTQIERLAAYWASRPDTRARGKGLGQPISIGTVNNQLNAANRFIKWLERNPDYTWEPPKFVEDALKVDLKQLRTDEEISSLRHGVETFTVEQLAIMYRHATEIDRLLILLGLNAAMSHAEMMSLRWDEVEGDPPTIKRVRRKSGVYGEVALWPETWAAIQSIRTQSTTVSPLVLVDPGGTPYNRERITYCWKTLRNRINREADEPVAWWLSFKYLRKTAAQLIRNESDGEIAGVFLSHGKPVASDELADLYSNRPFHRVAEALGKVRKRLEPMLATEPS